MPAGPRPCLTAIAPRSILQCVMPVYSRPLRLKNTVKEGERKEGEDGPLKGRAGRSASRSGHITVTGRIGVRSWSIFKSRTRRGWEIRNDFVPSLIASGDRVWRRRYCRRFPTLDLELWRSRYQHSKYRFSSSRVSTSLVASVMTRDRKIAPWCSEC